MIYECNKIPSSFDTIHKAKISAAIGGSPNSSASTRDFKIADEDVWAPFSVSTQTHVPLLRKTHTKNKKMIN